MELLRQKIVEDRVKNQKLPLTSASVHTYCQVLKRLHKSLGAEAELWQTDVLDRVKGKQFGDDAYAFEELIAELGATFLCAQLGISNDVRADHAKYIKSWIGKLRSDPKFLFQAASKAQKAIDLLNDYSYEVEEVAEVAA